MPTGRDAALVCSTLENAGIYAEICTGLPELERKISEGSGAVLLAEEALKNGALEYLESFNQQPVWSDLPIVLFAINGQNAERLLATVGTRFNATIVERPIRVMMLISAVRGALRARQKQYQARNLLIQLEESDKQKDLFLATLSHELRTPLNSILGWIQLARTDSNEAHVSHALEVIERNAKAQREIISDILFISQVITGKLQLELELIDLLPVIQSAVDVLLPSIEAKEIRLTTSFDADLAQISGDFDRLQQVFWNLLSNAIKFTPADGQIDIRVTGKSSNIDIEISDTGQGIKPDFLPFVFERFKQADNSYTRKFGGLGLGLAIVGHLVELHGGTVSVKSEGENRGATFNVTLPVAEKPADDPNSKPDDGQPLHQTKVDELLKGVHVLLVEDNDDSREMLRVILKNHGMNVSAVSAAVEALEIIKQNKTDILISDVGMPDIDGYELMTEIRRLPLEQNGNVPAVALTGYASLNDRARALESGYQEHLPKPIDIDKLFETIKFLITHHKSNTQNSA